MAVDPRKRQKKLERRKGKQKTERRALARRESQCFPARLQEAQDQVTHPMMNNLRHTESGDSYAVALRQMVNKMTRKTAVALLAISARASIMSTR